MAAPVPTPLLDFFKQGEVDRDVRMQAAQGVLAPRAHEQLAILVLLLEDKDREIRETADETLNKIPEQVLKTFLARSDAPLDLKSKPLLTYNVNQSPSVNHGGVKTR